MGDIQRMLNPKTVALIGAGEGPDTAGRTVLENLLRSGRQSIYAVHPALDTVLGLRCHRHVGEIKSRVDLAVVVPGTGAVAGHLEECGKAGIEGVIIVSSGCDDGGTGDRQTTEDLERVRRQYGIRVLGPDSLGLIRPDIGLNASLLTVRPRPGNIAFISQGNRISETIVDWNVRAHIGLSMFASLGSMLDVGFGDLIDIVGNDDQTRSIVLYMENVGNARRFLSAARGFARSKPIIVMKSGLFRSDAGPGRQGKPAMVSRCDQVYDGAFKRAGVVRVKEVADLFNVSQVLNAKIVPNGPKLAIITNASDAGTIAVDTLLLMRGELSCLSKETVDELEAFLPHRSSRGNPVNIMGDADVARFVRTIEICAKDRDTDGVLVICASYAVEEQMKLAEAVVGLLRYTRKPILCTVLGGRNTSGDVDIRHQSPVPTYNTPEEAVRTYLYMYKYKRNLELLYETPIERSARDLPQNTGTKSLMRNIRGKGSAVLLSNVSSSLLSAYGIPVLRPALTKSVQEARRAANTIGYPVFLKAELPDTLPAEKALVAWARSPEDLEKAYERLERQARDLDPEAAVIGITIRKMLENIDYQIRVGSKRDKDFGSVLFIGMGGRSAEIISDYAVGLPPLNHILARRLMEETRIFHVLPRESEDTTPPYFRELEDIIVNISNLIVDYPEVSEIDINPIAISNDKVYALDTKIVFGGGRADHRSSQYPHLVISPYPTRYTEKRTLPDGTEVLLRAIRPEDERLYLEMLNSLSRETMRNRFFSLLKDITHDMMTRFCNVDYDREITMVAETGSGDERKIAGVVTLIVESVAKYGQFAVLVRDDYHGKGLGYVLMDTIIRGAGREKGLEQIYGIVLSENEKMLDFCRKLGFTEEYIGSGTNRVTLSMRQEGN